MFEKVLKKHIEMVDKAKLSNTEKRVLLIKSALMAGMFSGGSISKVVRDISVHLGFSEATVWKVLKFDKMYKQIENDYMEVLEYLKQQKIKEMVEKGGGDSNSIA